MLQANDEYPVRVMMRSLLDTLHTPIVSDSDAKYYPFVENTKLVTWFGWPVRVLIRSPLHILHTPISLKDPEAKYSPLGENTTLETNDE